MQHMFTILVQCVPLFHFHHPPPSWLTMALVLYSFDCLNLDFFLFEALTQLNFYLLVKHHKFSSLVEPAWPWETTLERSREPTWLVFKQTPQIQSQTGGRYRNWNAFEHKSGEANVQKRMWHLLLLLLCPHVSLSVHIVAGNRLRPDVDVKSHPKKLDMSRDSEFSTKACSGNEAVCLFILGTLPLSGCLYLFHTLPLKCSCVSVSLSDEKGKKIMIERWWQQVEISLFPLLPLFPFSLYLLPPLSLSLSSPLSFSESYHLHSMFTSSIK